MARETPDALQAWEDYWSMGDGRSLQKLVSLYRARSVSGEDVPTKRLPTLVKWSSEHGWQERLKQRITEEEARTREEERKRNKAFRDRVRTGIEVDVRQYLKSLESANGAVLAEDAASLERMTKLFLALGGDPVADRQEVTGADGGPMQVQVEHDAAAVLADPGLRALAAELVGRASSRPPEPCESGDTPEPRDLADGAAPEAAQ